MITFFQYKNSIVTLNNTLNSNFQRGSVTFLKTLYIFSLYKVALLSIISAQAKSIEPSSYSASSHLESSTQTSNDFIFPFFIFQHHKQDSQGDDLSHKACLPYISLIRQTNFGVCGKLIKLLTANNRTVPNRTDPRRTNQGHAPSFPSFP